MKRIKLEGFSDKVMKKLRQEIIDQCSELEKKKKKTKKKERKK